MKPAKTSPLLGALIAGLLFVQGVARAQSASALPDASGSSPAAPDATSPDEEGTTEDDSVLVDDKDSPWSRGVSAEDRRAARAMIREGARLYLIPLYAKAAEQYMAALRKWKHPGIYYNLALTQRNMGKESDALENLERALEYGVEGLGSKRFIEAQKQLAALKRLLGRLRVVCRTPGVEVTLDGVIIFTGPGSFEGWVKTKSHELTAKKTGYLSEARRVTVVPERPQEIELKLVTLDEATDASRRWAVWKPWAVLVTGGVLVAGAGGLHALASRNFADYDTRFQALDCAKGNPPHGCMKDDPGVKPLDDQLRRARQEQIIAVGGYVLGGAVITTGIVLLYMNRSRLVEQGASRAQAQRVALIPVASRETFGLLVNVSH